MVSSALIGLSVAVGLLALLDIFFSEKQKERLAHWVTEVWNYLDNLRAFSLADWLRHPRAALWHAISIVIFTSVISMLVVISRDRALLGNSFNVTAEVTGATVLFLAFSPIAAFFSYNFFSNVLADIHGEKFWLGLFVIIIVLVVMLAGAVLFLAADEYVIRTKGQSLPFLLLVALGFAKFLFGSCRTTLIGMTACLFALFASIVLSYVATAMLLVGEFVVRRVAEYPKGPILALSAILTTLLTLIKSFVGG